MNGTQDTQYFDPDERFGQKLDFNTIIMRQIDKVRTAGSVEWKGGYWERKPYAVAGTMTSLSEVYIPDTRQVYINSVDSLLDLMIPYIDEQFKKENKVLEKAYNDKVSNLRDAMKKEFEKTSEDEARGSISDQFQQKVLEEHVEHQRRVFWELLRLIKRQGLIDTPGTREVA